MKKTNDLLRENMPLLSEFTNYSDLEIGAKRRTWMLHIRPVSMKVDYFINNMEEKKTSEIDTNAGGFLKQKVNAKVGGNERAILKWETTNRYVLNGRSWF